MIEKLKSLGVTISIDDFYTSFLSLSYLTKFPIDTLKIDCSFVRYVHEGSHQAVICKGGIGLSHGLSLEVIAEGGEESAQLQFMQENNCDIIFQAARKKRLQTDCTTRPDCDLGLDVRIAGLALFKGYQIPAPKHLKWTSLIKVKNRKK